MNKELLRQIVLAEFSAGDWSKASTSQLAASRVVDAVAKFWVGEVDSSPEPFSAPMRKIIAATTAVDREGHRVVTAVCDDGTAWTKSWDGMWRKLPAIPQEDAP